MRGPVLSSKARQQVFWPTILGGPVAGDEAVSSVVGTILMLGITVTIFAGISLGILGYFQDASDPPTATIGALATDTSYILVHRGGQTLDVQGGELIFSVDGAVQRVSLTTFSTALGGTQWNVGQSICVSGPSPPCMLDHRAVTGAMVVVQNRVIAKEGTIRHPAQCAWDVTPPVASNWTQIPADVQMTHDGSVEVQVQFTDDCYGMNATSPPKLFHRINDGTNPAYTAVTMTGSASAWTGMIPDPDWVANRGKTLEYCVGDQVDTGGNQAVVPPCAPRQDLIENTCPSDTTPPTELNWVQTPGDVKTTTVGAITVRVTLTDNCYGVSQTVAPRLFFRINGGTNPAYTDAGLMSLTGTSTWQGTIPSQNWAIQGGKTLEYYVTGQSDRGGNIKSGIGALRGDLIDTNPVSTYVSTNTPAIGTVTNFGAMQSAGDAGAAATLTEAIALRTTTLAATGVVTGQTAAQWTNPSNALISDGAVASTTSATRNLQIALADTLLTGTVTKVQLRAQVAIQGASSGDGFRLRACFGGTCGTQSATVTVGTSATWITFDATAARPGGGTWSWQDLQDLEIRLTNYSTNPTGETWRVDAVEAAITHTGTRSTLGAMATLANPGTYTTPNNAWASNNLYATVASTNAAVTYGIADQVGSPGTVSAVTLAVEASIVGFSDDGFSLQACLGATCAPSSPFLTSAASDSALRFVTTRPGGGSWTWADINALSVQVTALRSGAGDGTWRIDYAWIEVDYNPGNVYNLDIQFDFSGVPAAGTQTLELRYAASSDTFQVWVWDGSTYRVRGSNLNAATMSHWSYVLTASEYNSGAPRIRVMDTIAGASAASLQIDYLRVTSA